MIEPIVKTITVPCAPEKAFDIFVRQIGNWWPLETHSISSGKDGVAKTAVIEPKLGGAVYEISPDGERLDWGHVSEFTEGVSLAMKWHLYRPKHLGTVVSVKFAPHKDGTEVVLRHDNWDVLGDDGAEFRENYNNGWVFVFETQYANACQA